MPADYLQLPRGHSKVFPAGKTRYATGIPPQPREEASEAKPMPPKRKLQRKRLGAFQPLDRRVRRRGNLDGRYKHAVLGLILKYVSDSFAMRQREIEA
jgi:hypothetical protein